DARGAGLVDDALHIGRRVLRVEHEGLDLPGRNLTVDGRLVGGAWIRTLADRLHVSRRGDQVGPDRRSHVADSGLRGADRRARVPLLDGGDRVVVVLESAGPVVRALLVEVRGVAGVQVLEVRGDALDDLADDVWRIPHVRIAAVLHAGHQRHVEEAPARD